MNALTTGSPKAGKKTPKKHWRLFLEKTRTRAAHKESGGNSIKKVVEIPKILAKLSVEDEKNHPKRPHRPRTSPGQKGRKKPKKTSAVFFVDFFCRKKTFF
jgi:hypothetical protein